MRAERSQRMIHSPPVRPNNQLMGNSCKAATNQCAVETTCTRGRYASCEAKAGAEHCTIRNQSALCKAEGLRAAIGPANVMMPKNHTYQGLGELGTLFGCPSTATIQPLTGQDKVQQETPQKFVRSLGSLGGVALLIKPNNY